MLDIHLIINSLSDVCDLKGKHIKSLGLAKSNINKQNLKTRADYSNKENAGLSENIIDVPE